MRRSSKGNMLVLSGVFVMVNAVALVVASSFGSLYFVHNRMQSSADELALIGAQKLNQQDRIGQMNNMIARSRQLVFDADESNQLAQNSMNHLNDLSQQLYDESHEGAVLMETEREKLRNVSSTEATSAIMTRFNQLKDGHQLQLPWLQASSLTAPVISFGCTGKIESNVPEISTLDQLDNADVSKGYVAADGSKLYRSNIDAKLTGNASDLSFKISSLPAPVQTYISPARAILAKNFQQVPSDQLYSTVQVSFHLNVDNKIGATTDAQLQSTGTAVATGGQPMM